MGRDKPWLPWRRGPVLGHVVDCLARAVDEVLVVCAPGQALPEVAARRVEDREEGLGPLAGLAAGLAASAPGMAFVTAADAPFLTPRFVAAVLARGGAAAPVAEGRVHPLSAAYPSRAGREARSLLDEGRRRPLDLLERCEFESLPLSELPDPEGVEGFNTPDEYLAAARADAPDARAHIAFVSSKKPGAPRSHDVAIGSLGELLLAAGGDPSWIEDNRLIVPYRACLDGRIELRDARVPIGRGEEVSVFGIEGFGQGA